MSDPAPTDDREAQVEALTGLEQYHTGPPNDIYVIQGHQLRDWLAARDAQRDRAAGEKALRDAAEAARQTDYETATEHPENTEGAWWADWLRDRADRLAGGGR